MKHIRDAFPDVPLIQPTLIEESESLQCQAAEDTAEQLSEQLPGLRVSLVHGRMKAVTSHAFAAYG